MRRAVTISWLVLAVMASAPAQTTIQALAQTHAERIHTFFPRLESSPGEKQATDYITATLETDRIGYSVVGFADYDSGHSFSRIIEVVIGGGEDETLVVAVPLNHSPDSSPDADGSAAVGSALALAQHLSLDPPDVTVRILFLGADVMDEGSQRLGTDRFLSEYYPDGPHALAYIEVARFPPVLQTGANGAVTPPWLIERTIQASEQAGFDPVVRAELNQIHRLGISDGPTALSSFLNADIPSIYVGSSPPGLRPQEPGRVARDLSTFLTAWIRTFQDGIPETWDKHYLFFSFGTNYLFIREQFFVVILLAAILITLVYGLFARRRFRRYLETIGRNIWNLPFLFLLAFAFLAASSYLINLFLLARGFPDMWQYYPAAFTFLKISLLMLGFTLFSRLLRSLPFSKNGSFYSAAALFVLFIDIVVFSAINISFSFYFIWAYIWAFVFSVVKRRGLKIIALVIAPYFLVQAAVSALRVTEIEFTRAILLSTTGDLMLSFVTLPFLLMLIRIDFLFRHPVRGRRSIALGAVSGASAVVTVGITVFLALSTPYTRTNPQPVRALEQIDYRSLTRTLFLSSPAPLNELDVRFADEQFFLESPGRLWQMSTNTLPDVLTVRLSYEEFLDRDRGQLVIDAPAPVEDLKIRLFSEEPIVLYDASLPYAIEPDQRRAEIFVGTRPSLPIEIDFTVAQGAPPGIEVEAVSYVHPDPLIIRGEDIQTVSRMRVITRFEQ